MNKVILLFVSILMFNGCVQTTAMVGPAMTLVSTGNVYQAGVSFGANKAVENETGMSTTQLFNNKINNNQTKNQNDINDSLTILLDLNIEKTRKILIDKNNIYKNN
tara:strand:- start:145 stop:462 length:318 start_codon:yes stop_codon:yes gene_type:complete